VTDAPVVETERLRLRPIGDEDVEAWHTGVFERPGRDALSSAARAAPSLPGRVRAHSEKVGMRFEGTQRVFGPSTVRYAIHRAERPAVDPARTSR